MNKGFMKAGELPFMKEFAAKRRDLPDSSSVSPQVQEALQSIEKTIAEAAQRPSAEIIQLPLWHEGERGAPNSFLRTALFAAIQSKDRKYLQGVQLAGSKDVSVKYTGQQLNQEDLSVWETLVHLAREHPLGNVCQFTAHGLLRKLGLHTGGHEHKRLHETLTRMVACAVEIKHEGRFYIGSLIEKAAGMDGNAPDDEPKRHYALILNRDLINLFGETQWTAILWDQRKQLRRQPLAQALHGYYSTHRVPLPVKVDTLRRFVGSANEQKAGFKRHLKKALEELVEVKFLVSYEIDDKTELVRVVRV
jgi:hypothetical protein